MPTQHKQSQFSSTQHKQGAFGRGQGKSFSPTQNRKYQNRSQRPQESEFEQRVIKVDRVTRVTAGGRRFNFRVLVVAGDRKGRVGMGLGKAKDISEAINKAARVATKKLITVPLFNGTIPFSIRAKFKMVEILLKPAPVGRGIVAGGTVRDICELAGIENINAKVISVSKNKINNAKAVLWAFERIKNILKVKQAIFPFERNPIIKHSKEGAQKTIDSIVQNASKQAPSLNHHADTPDTTPSPTN